MRLLAVLERWPRSLSLVMAVVLLGIIGYLDYITGYELSFAVAYLIPIFLLTWSSGRWVGLVGALVCAAIRTGVDALGGHPYSHPLYMYWIAVMRFGLFVGVAIVLDALRRLV